MLAQFCSLFLVFFVLLFSALPTNLLAQSKARHPIVPASSSAEERFQEFTAWDQSALAPASSSQAADLLRSLGISLAWRGLDPLASCSAEADKIATTLQDPALGREFALRLGTTMAKWDRQRTRLASSLARSIRELRRYRIERRDDGAARVSWNPSEERFEKLLSRVEREGIEVEPETVRLLLGQMRFRATSGEAERELLVVTTTTLVVLIGLSVASSVGFYLAKVAQGREELNCTGLLTAVLVGLAGGLASGLGHVSSLVTAAHIFLSGIEDATVVDTFVDNETLSNYLALAVSPFELLACLHCNQAGAPVLPGVWGLLSVLASGTLQTCIQDTVARRYGDAFSQVAEQADNVPAASAISVQILDATGNVRTLVSYDDRVYWSVQFSANAPGPFEVEVVAFNKGQEYVVATETANSSVGGWFIASELLDQLDENDGTELFQFAARLSQGSWNAESPLGARPGVVLADRRVGNIAPELVLNDRVSGGIVEIGGVYRDENGDEPAWIRLLIDGVERIPLLDDPTPCDSADQVCVNFHDTKFLSDGIHTLQAEASDGIEVTSTALRQLRVSSTAPQVSFLSLQPTTTDVGQSVQFSVSLSDALGGVPDRSLQLANDDYGYFTDLSGSPQNYFVTDNAGTAQGRFIPTSGGRKTLVVRDIVSRDFDYTFLDVTGESSGDFTADWQWTLVSSTEDEATYQCQVRIRRNGQPLQVGDDVIFAANHGQFAHGSVNVPDSPPDFAVTNNYHLTRAEADSGSEVITITIAQYGFPELNHVTELPVGAAPACGVTPQIMTLSGSSQENISFPTAVSQDGLLGAACSGNNAVVYDITRRSAPVALWTVPRSAYDDCNTIDFSPNGAYLAIGDQHGYITIARLSDHQTSTRQISGSTQTSIFNLDWYQDRRVGVVTEGTKFLIVDPLDGANPSPTILVDRTSSLNGATTANDGERIVCTPATNICGVASYGADGGLWWLVNAETGQRLANGTHPDNNPVLAFAFNSTGTRFFLGGDDDGGQTFYKWYATTSTSASLLSQSVLPTFRDIFGAAYVVNPQGATQLALAGNSKIELFSDTGGAVQCSVPYGLAHDDSLHLEYLPSRGELVAIDSAKQGFVNLSSDRFGPSFSVPSIPCLRFDESSAQVSGSVEDPSGTASLRYQVDGLPVQDVSLSGFGVLPFSFEVLDVPFGSTPLTLTATDTYGNVSVYSTSLCHLDDTTAPAITSLTASPSSGPAGTSHIVSCNVNESESGLSSVQMSVRDSLDNPVLAPVQMSNTSGDTFESDFSSTGFSPGAYSVVVDALDNRGNSGSTSVPILVVACHSLNLTHDGLGADPVPAPSSSAGCAAGQYSPGEVISLDAGPGADSGWTIGSCCQNSCGGWTGTDNDASRSEQNQVTMPAADHTVTVVYSQQCTTPPVAIQLIDFSATPDERGTRIRWQTGYESNNLGFHLYREDSSGTHRITPSLIAGSALLTGSELTQGYSYAWLDPSGEADASYWLEDVDLDGRRARYGPFPLGAGPKPSHTGLTDSKTVRRLGTAAGSPAAAVPANWSPESTSDTETRLATQRWLAASDSLKIQVRAEGLYRISQPELVAAGLRSDVPAQSLRLFSDGIELPLLVSGEEDGRLDPEDFLIFHGVGQSTPWTDVQTYWLVVSEQPGTRLHSFPADGTPGPESFLETLEWKPRTTYFSSLQNGDEENFFGPTVADEEVDQIFDLRHFDPLSLQAGRLEVALQGVFGEHEVSVSVNGFEVGRLVSAGTSHAQAEFELPVGALHPGRNEIRLLGNGDGEDVSLVDRVRLTYPRLFEAEQDRLAFVVAGGSQVRVAGFDGETALALDVTDPVRPVLLETSSEPDVSGFSVSITAPPGDQRRILVSSREALLAPEGVIANRSSRWSEEESGGEAVFITHRDVEEEILRLQRFRESQGRTVLMVDVEDLYDEYSYGSPTPYALREFLRDGARRWRTRPRFLLLAGDASLDPKNYLGFGRRDSVPTRIAQSRYSETADDDWFGDLDGGGATDLAVGRLPVDNADEARTVVDKIINYETAPRPGVWRSSAVMVSDWQDDFPFDQESARLRRLLPSDWNVTEISRSQEDSPGQLLRAIQRGQAVIGYLGHGSVQRWAGGLLSSDQAVRLGNGGRLPFVISMACLTGLFQGERQSLAEALLGASQGGAIAVLASPSLDGAREQTAFGEAVFGRLFDHSGETLGQTIQRAKREPGVPQSISNYVFFGDPMTRLVGPGPAWPSRGWRPRN